MQNIMVNIAGREFLLRIYSNIYLDVWAYWSAQSLLSFNQVIYNHRHVHFYTTFLTCALMLWGLNEEPRIFFSIFVVQQNIKFEASWLPVSRSDFLTWHKLFLKESE